MSDRIITLKPFLSTTQVPQISLIAKVSYTQASLKISYLLRGDLNQIELPSAENGGIRRDNLWQTTCFEFFLAIFNSPQYWEFNLASTGDWNVYRFAKYRREMREEAAFKSLPCQTQADDSQYQIETKVNLKPIIVGNTPLEIAVSAVIEDINHNLSYWAITHPGTEADFHRRDSFITL